MSEEVRCFSRLRYGCSRVIDDLFGCISRLAGATAEAVKKAFELLLSEKAVKSIFVNIFGGMYVVLISPQYPTFADSCSSPTACAATLLLSKLS
jgi:hypothetical protein